MSQNNPTKWGIVGAGLISHDFVNAFSIRSEHQAVAVAARDLQKAQDFASKFDIPKAYGRYEELSQDPKVEIAYVGVIAPQHYKVVKLMLHAGKHVLCEKPLGIDVKQVKEMLDLAKAKGLFFMEAIWSRTFPIYKKLRNLLDNKVVGEPKHVIITFAQEQAPDSRLTRKETGGGTLLDFGVYAIQMCLLAYNGQKPTRIQATAIGVNENGVDIGLNVNMHFPNDGFATFNTDLRVKMSNRAIIAGRNGVITVAGPFWCPTTLCTTSTNDDDWCDDYPLPSGARYPFNFVNSEGLVHEADHVRNCLQDKLLQSPLVSHQDSLIIAEIQNEIMKQIGVSYL